MKQKTKQFPYVIQHSWSGDMKFFVWRTLNRLLEYTALRYGRPLWGIVYDSRTKQPLDPVLVRLAYVDSSKVETVITDMEGRYGFLVRPGKFKIFPNKTAYSFPSKTVRGDTDGVFDHLYHGEFFQLTGDWEVLAPNIPMDADTEDWNQKAKRLFMPKFPTVMLWRRRIMKAFFWFVFFSSFLAAVVSYPDLNKYFFPIFVLCFSLLCCAVAVPPVRLWGVVRTRGADVKEEGLLLELNHPSVPGVVLGKSVTKTGGRFLLRASPGSYVLRVKKQGSEGYPDQEIARKHVKVYHEGVLNDDLFLRQQN